MAKAHARDASVPKVAATWTPVPPVVEERISLFINCPPEYPVKRNHETGQIEIENLLIDDLIGLRNSIDQQITELQGNSREKRGWETL